MLDAPLPARPYLRFGDALRAIAIALVVLSHVVMVVPVLRPLEPYRLALGSFGVSAFFVLSGFLLGRPYVDALLRGSALPAWKPYARRRFVRIWPAYACVVAIATAKSLAHHGSNGMVLADFATHLAMIHNFFPAFVAGADNIALWTMAVDAQFYVALPIVAWLILRIARGGHARAGIVAALAVVVSISLAWRIAVAFAFPNVGELTIQRNLIGMGTSFAVGVLLAYFEASALACPARIAKPLTLAAIAVFLFDLAVAAIVPDASAFKFLELDLLGALAVGTFVFAIPHVASPRLDRILASRLVAIGAANAYALYLVHVPIKQTIDALLTSRHIAAGTARYGLLFSIAFCLSCALAAPLLHHLIERPFLKMRPVATPLHEPLIATNAQLA